MSTPKILLVDDTKLFLKLEQEFLKHSSVVVLTAGNGQEALEIARKARPDLIYMDLNMPGMDGAACCAALKADPDLRSIPVVLVTSEGSEESIARCKMAGCDGFLSKPVDRKLFLDIGRSFLPTINRREKRIPGRIKVLLKRNNGGNEFGTCLDLCSRGMYIACASAAEVQVEDKLEVSMLLSGNSDGLVEAWCRVSWTNVGPSRKKPQLSVGFGVEFLAITEEAAELLKEFLDKGMFLP